MIQHKEPGKLPSHDTGTRKSGYDYVSLDFTCLAPRSLVITHPGHKRWKRNGCRMLCTNKLTSQNIQLFRISILGQQFLFRNSTEFYFVSCRDFSMAGTSGLGLSFLSRKRHPSVSAGSWTKIQSANHKFS